jgi:DNA replicative helicase MCM subunit Mcm2 (Cdc46/Mcm family)
MDYGEAVQEFEEFFQEAYKEEVEEFSENRKDDLTVSYMKIDMFSPPLADYIRENGENGIGAAEEGLQICDEITEDVYVWFNNFPDHEVTSPAYISSDDIQNYIAMQIKVKDASEITGMVVAGVFECIQCGDLYEKDQDKSSKMKTPYKCECGCRKFDVHQKIMADYQEIEPLTGYKKLDVEIIGDDVKTPPDIERHEIILYGILKTRDENKTETSYVMEGEKVEVID